MTIKARRLTKLLAPLGFRLSYEDKCCGNIWFSRPSSVHDLFEHIHISTYGDRHRTIASSSWVSVTSEPGGHDDLAVDRFHRELCTDSKWSFSEVNTKEEAMAWEQSLADFVDQDLRSLASEFGLELLRRTEHARAIAKEYWKRLRASYQETNCDYLAVQLKAGMSREQLIEPERIAGLTSLGLSVSEVAAITIQMFSQEVEGIRDPFVGQGVHENEWLEWRLEFLTDLILRDNPEHWSKM